MKETKSVNIPTLDVTKTVDSLSSAYVNLIKSKTPFKAFPSVMLWGAPGVGKSQAVRQIADKIKEGTGKKVVVTDVRLLLFNPIDLRGIPTANEDKTLAVWLKPQIFQMDDSKSVVNILFLDEISAAPQSVQASAYQITLDRTVGEHKLPENCIVIGAGNRITDKSVAFRMPRALANRLMHIEVESNYDSWKKWALEKGINHKVIGFINFRRDLLCPTQTNSEDLAFPTPRSWEMVSNVLNFATDDKSDVFPFISGLVGIGVATEFRSWLKVYASLPSIEKIFEGKETEIPYSADSLYALVSSMTAYAREHKDEIPKIVNSIRYAQLLPADFSALLLFDYTCIEKGYKEKLLRVPEFVKWLNTKGKLLNGNI